jgi:hypothetical protein
MISRGCSLEAWIAGKIPENKTINIAIPEICRRIGVTSAGSIIGIPSNFSYIFSMAGAPKNTPRIIPNKQPIKPIKMGIKMYPGIIVFRGIPSVRNIAISLA